MNGKEHSFTFLNSGPNSIAGFVGLVLALFLVTKPSTRVYRSDCERISKNCKLSVVRLMELFWDFKVERSGLVYLNKKQV